MSLNTPDLKTDPSVLALDPVLSTVRSFARQLLIKSSDGYQSAAAELKRIKGALATIEDARTRITKPLNDTLREVNTQAKTAAAPYLDEERSIKRAMVTFDDEQQRIRQEQQRRENERAEKERLRLQAIADAARQKGDEAKAEKFEDRSQAIVAPVVQTAPPKVAGVTTRSVWKYEITDAKGINAPFLMPDERKIGRQVQAMGSEAAPIVGPGIRIWSEKQIASGRA